MREYKAMHEENFGSSWRKEDEKGKEERMAKAEKNEEKGEKRKREEGKEEHETGEAFEIFSQGRLGELC